MSYDQIHAEHLLYLAAQRWAWLWHLGGPGGYRVRRLVIR